MGQIALERVDAIENLERKMGSAPAVNESELQQLLEKAPWLIDSEWTVLQANKSFESMRLAFGRWYEQKYNRPIVTRPVSSGGRPDFVMLPVSGSVELVEIKKKGHSLTDEEFARLRGYYDAMERFFAENPDFRSEFSRTHLTLICDGLRLTRDIGLAFEKLVGDGILKRTTWEEVLAHTKKSHHDFLELRSTQNR